MISALNLEVSVKSAVSAWLAGWFNGLTHPLPGALTPVLFPAVPIVWDQGTPPQPLAAEPVPAEFRLVLHPGRSSFVPTPGQRMCVTRFRLDLYVRARTSAEPDATGRTSTQWCAELAALAHALMSHRALAGPLAQQGVGALRPRPPLVVPLNEYACRLITATLEAVYYQVEGVAS